LPDQRREPDAGNALRDADSATLADRGRTVLGGVAAAADRAGDALSEAQDHVEGLSDVGVLAVAGFAVGVTTGLLLAGAPRLIIAVSLLPVGLTVRSALSRGMRPSRLLN
jgi:hypothetical protein